MAYRNLERRRTAHREWMRQWRLAHGIQPRVTDPVQRFWAKVDKSGPNGCWVWIGDRVRGPHRYGRLWTNRRPKLAHRISWEIHVGPIPSGALVCHHCDNPPCVNPEHLFLGTDRDNNHDMIAKGRARHPKHTTLWRQRLSDSQRGARNSNARLTDAQVAAIRRLYAAGQHSQQAIADRFGVHQTWVSSIVRGKRT